MSRFRLHDALREPRDRDADVRDERLRSGSQRHPRVERVVARGPQAAAVLGPRRPLELDATVLARDLAEHLGLLGDARLGAVKLEEERRLLRVRELGERVHAPHHHFVEQLDPRDRNTGLDRENHGIHRGFQ